MLLTIDGKNRGIRCDLSGVEMRDSFTYYSVVGRCVHVSGARAIPNKDMEIDIDISESAYKEIVDRCRSHASTMSNDPSIVRCDLSGKMMAGQYTYWHLTFDRVVVDSSKQDDSGAFLVSASPNEMDMNISEEVCQELLGKRAWHRRAR